MHSPARESVQIIVSIAFKTKKLSRVGIIFFGIVIWNAIWPLRRAFSCPERIPVYFSSLRI